MADCSKTDVFFAEWKRMCETCDKDCKCEFINSGITAGCPFCEDNVRWKIPEAIKIMQEWSDAHQKKTRQSELLKVFPNATLYKDGIPVICPIALEGEGFGCDDDGDGSLCDKCYQEYWLAEVE